MLVQLRVIGAALATCLLLCLLPQGASADFVQPPASPYAIGSEEIEGIATGDLNGDGRTDVVTVNWGPLFTGPPSYSVLLAGANGSLSPAPGSPVGISASETPYRVALGDVNNDGKLDLIMTQEGKVTVRLGNGNGTFASTPVATLTAGSEPLAVAGGDLNGDGNDDIVVANYGGNSVSVFYSQGDGSFVQAPSSPYAVGSQPYTVSIGDFNGDHRGDILTANKGAFFADAFSVLLAQPGGSYAAGESLEGEYQQLSAAIGDFDGDGNQDFAGVASPNQAIPAYLGDGSGKFSATPSRPSIPSHWGEDLAVADFNGDGLDDLAVPVSLANTPEDENTVWVFTSQGGGSFAGGVSYSVEPGFFPKQIATGDFNGDGKPDLVVANASSNLTVLLDAEPEMVVAPTEVDFGEVGLHTPAGPEAVTISNEGLAPLELAGIELSGADAGDFSFDDSDCGSLTIPAGGSCEVEVDFEPSLLGAREATLKISPKSGPAAEVELRGEGVANPAGTLTPATHDFGIHPLGEGTGPSQIFTLESTGTTALHAGTVTLAGAGVAEFELGTDGCAGVTLEPGESCTVEVIFEPGAIGHAEAALVVGSDAPGTLEAELSGEGAPNPDIAVAPAEFDFGAHPAGAASGPTKAFTVESTGVTPLVVESIALGGTDPGEFELLADACSGQTLATGLSCEVEVEFAPASIGAAAAELEIGAATIGVTEVELRGEGAANPAATLTPASGDFGTRALGEGAGPTQAFTLESTGTTALQAGPAAIGGADPTDFRVGLDACSGKTLLPGQSCRVEVSFAPTVAGGRTATLEVPTNVGATPSTAALSGTAVAAAGDQGKKQESPPPPSPPVCESVAVKKLAPYKVKTRRVPKELGLRARFTTGVPALLEIAATLRYVDGGPRTISLGKTNLQVRTSFANYRAPLPARLRTTLPFGTKVTLKLRYRAKGNGPGCSSFGPTKTKSVATRVVWIAR